MTIRAESYKRGVVSSIGIGVLSKGAGFFVTILIAYLFGATTQTDIHFFAFSIITLLSSLFTAITGSILVPKIVNINVQQGKGEALVFFNTFLYGFGAATILLALLLTIYPPLIVIGGAFTSVPINEARTILIACIACLPLLVITNLLSSVLNAFKLFTVPMTVNLATNCIALLFIYLLNPVFGVASIAMGLACGYTFNILFLFSLLIKRVNWSFGRGNWSYVKTLKSEMSQLQFIQVLYFVQHYALLSILGMLGSGVITAYNYAFQLIRLPSNLIMNQFISVSKIKFADVYAGTKDLIQMNSLFSKLINVLLMLLLPITFIYFIFSDEIVRLLFDRGKIDEEGLSIASFVLHISCFLIPLDIVFNVSTNLLQATLEVGKYIRLCVFNVLVLLLCYFLASFSMSLTMVLVYVLIATAFSASLALWYASKVIYHRWDGSIIKGSWVFVVVNVLVAALVLLLISNLPLIGYFGFALGLLCFGSASVFLVNRFFETEFFEIIGLLKRN